MGLFSNLFESKEEKAKKEHEKLIKDLSKYDDLRVEVVTVDGLFLFKGRFFISESGTISINQIGEVKRLQNSYDVHLRLYSFDEQIVVFMLASIKNVYSNTWAVSNIEIVKKENERNSYRIQYIEKGKILKNGVYYECVLSNLSVTGGRFQSDALLGLGEELKLQINNFEYTYNNPLSCKVRRTDGKKNGLYVYGCSFEDLSRASESLLSKKIMEKQRKQK